MESSNNTQIPGRSGNTALYVTVVIVIIILVAGYLLFGRSNEVTAPTTAGPNETPTTPSTDTTPVVTEDSKYKDGTYSVKGNYISPGGPEEIPVTITLKDDIITAATMTVNSPRPMSQNFQTQFHDNFQPFVIGKNIDSVTLTKVSGSSLTPKGFNDALAKVKVEAQS